MVFAFAPNPLLFLKALQSARTRLAHGPQEQFVIGAAQFYGLGACVDEIRLLTGDGHAVNPNGWRVDAMAEGEVARRREVGEHVTQVAGHG